MLAQKHNSCLLIYCDQLKRMENKITKVSSEKYV